MKILNKTPRTEMFFSAIVIKMGTFYEALGEELGVGKDAADSELGKFATFSVRIEPEKGDFDFALARATDSPEQIREKFLKYIDTQCYREVEKALQDIRMLDLPLTPSEQTPKLVEDADPN